MLCTCILHFNYLKLFRSFCHYLKKIKKIKIEMSFCVFFFMANKNIIEVIKSLLYTWTVEFLHF